jgi:hypothetical protein
MKTLVLGDTHGRSNWKLAVHQENPDRVIFIGDYFDSFDITGVEQIQNFKDIIKYKETSFSNVGTLKERKTEVILLIGNHDLHYFPEVGNTGTSGYQARIAPSIMQVIDENRQHLQMAYQFDDFVFSHAGISIEFLDQVFSVGGWQVENMVDKLNELFKYKPRLFDFNGMDPYGDNTYQTPVWIRPRSLMKANKNILNRRVIQIVGHTEMRKLDLKGSEKSAGGRYYFIDCMGTSGEYLVIEDGKLRVGSTR